jgi:hypothetical protein
LGGEFAGGPVVEHDVAFVDAGTGDYKRIRHLRIGFAERVGEIYEEQLGAEALLLGGGKGAVRLIVAQEAGGTFEL